MRFRGATLIVVSAAFVAACGGGGGTAGGAGNASAGPSAPILNLGAPTVKLPFGGDVCQSLTAADFPGDIAGTSGWTLTKTEVGANMGGDAKTACFYDLTSGDGSTSQPGVAYESVDIWDSLKQIAVKSTDNPYQAVSGVGEDAYLVNAFGQNVLYVKAKGYRIVISGVDPFNDLPTLKLFAGAILGRI
ncbi:MAG TPA: hypothetical protein VFC03_08700 [Acidimicrobiales bacterium]|jgi:hypothetical protein|nr:hypothetical protein [Acidimicrobiales bacterium]